ncbi:FH protein interacting protein FIP2, partial [Mucuna pruriens]
MEEITLHSMLTWTVPHCECCCASPLLRHDSSRSATIAAAATIDNYLQTETLVLIENLLAKPQGLIDGVHAILNKRKEDDESHTELTRTDIIKCIQSEKVRFRGVNLSGLDLSKLDLSYVDFSYACLKNVFFSRANLQCAKFRDVDAEASIFHNATLRECEFTGANLCGALLAGACLQSANLQDACLVDCSFCGADLRTAHLQNADLTNANLEGAVLEGANLKGAKLNNANLKGANLQRAYLRHVNLRDTVRGLMVPICSEQSDNIFVLTMKKLGSWDMICTYG